MKFTGFVYFPCQLESVGECCKASPTAVLTLGREGDTSVCTCPFQPSVSTAV